MANYVLLERIELNASAASVTFSNIPQTGYTDLKVVMSARVTGTGTVANIKINFNGSSTSFTNRYIGGNGSSASSGSLSGTDGPLSIWTANYNDTTSNTFGNAEIYIPNYTFGNYKSFSVDGVAENNATDGRMAMNAMLWSNNDAIASVTLVPQTGSFMQYSTFSLYGLAAVGTTPAIAPKASGGSIYNDGTYWYHTFLASGTFTPQTSLSCDVLQVAGGGGGQAGGGGAGGLAYTSSNSLSATNYTVTIGAGGANTVSGSNSQFGALTAAVGGGGASSWGTAGQNGGSGGGGGSVSGTVVNGGTGTAGQGNNGGSGVSSRAGGGGGAGAAGANGATNGGVGGVGLNTYSSWATATSTGVSGYYAGGGGGGANGTGGAGGLGGGGTGSNASPTAGTVNTGGGGGGAYGAAGQPGGSGIVIIRYAV